MANVNQLGQAKLYPGVAGVNDNDIVITAGNVQQFSKFALQSAAGAVDVEASVDGTTYGTGVIAMQDGAATASSTYVLVTAPGGIYQFTGKFTSLRIRQNGATAATGVRLLCGN